MNASSKQSIHSLHDSERRKSQRKELRPRLYLVKFDKWLTNKAICDLFIEIYLS